MVEYNKANRKAFSLIKHNRNSKKTFSSTKNESKFGVLFAMPVILGLLLFTIGPMIASFILSFTDYRGVNAANFVGFSNYTRLFNGQDTFFFKSLAVTLYYAVLSAPLSLIAAFIMALLLNQDYIKGKPLFRTIYYLPSIVPAVATSMIWLWLLNPDLGLVNHILSLLHLPTSKWLFDEKSVIPSLALMSYGVPEVLWSYFSRPARGTKISV